MQTNFNFTKAELERLPNKTKQYEVRDAKCNGLVLRVNPAGTKTYIFWKKKHGRNVKIKIGHFPGISIENARKQADLLRTQMNSGYTESTKEVSKPSSINFHQLYQRYYSEYAVLHTKRPQDNKAQLSKHILPEIGHDLIDTITKQKMKDIHRNMGLNSGKPQANRMLDMTSAVFNFGITEELFKGPNPCLGIKRFKRRSRDRFLNKNELRMLFHELKQEREIFRDFFILSILIGARKSTMLSMKFSDIDFSLKRWRVCEDEAKNDEVNVFHLCDYAVNIIERRLKENQSLFTPSIYVFPGIGRTGHLVNPRKAYQRIKARIGVSDITIHDLRRTLGSYMAISNVSMPIIAKALNHKSQASTEIYARLSQEPVQQAINLATETILKFV